MAGDDEEQAIKAIELLVKGSNSYYYLYFLHRFRKVGLKGLTPEEQSELDQFTTDQRKSGEKLTNEQK